jgi:hypothetical protein
MSMVAAGIRHIMYEKKAGVYQYDQQHKFMSACILEAVYRKD